MYREREQVLRSIKGILSWGFIMLLGQKTSKYTPDVLNAAFKPLLAERGDMRHTKRRFLFSDAVP